MVVNAAGRPRASTGRPCHASSRLRNDSGRNRVRCEASMFVMTRSYYPAFGLPAPATHSAHIEIDPSHDEADPGAGRVAEGHRRFRIRFHSHETKRLRFAFIG